MTRFVLVISALLIVRSASAQPADAVRCETDANERKARWAASTHSAIDNAVEAESQELALSWCRALASSGEQRVHGFENVGRVLFTGDGIHPVVGTIAPGNGLGGGVVWNSQWNSLTRPLRYSTNLEARMSLNRSWATGAALNVIGSAASESNHHRYGRIDVRHAHINEVSYFGPGNTSGSDQTVFGLRSTTAQTTLVSAMRHGLSVFGTLAAVHATPATPPSGTTSVSQRFSDRDAPAIGRSTGYAVFGGGVGARYPEDEISEGYSTALDVSVRRYAEITGQPYSFTRTMVGWQNSYTPHTDVDAGTFSANARVVLSGVAGQQRIPFYLQPTLGGADVDGVGGLRSYPDYRFRDPDLITATVGYTRSIRDPLALLFFYDVGRVADRAADLLNGHFKQSVGAGIALRVGGFAVAEFYVAWGPDGSRFNFTGNSNRLGTDPTRSGLF